MYGNRKVYFFFASMVRFKISFLEILQLQVRTTLHHNNVQVTIFVMCLNFAGAG